MGGSPPERSRRSRRLAPCWGLLTLLVGATSVSGQVEARPVMDGSVLLGDTVLRGGTVVLHHIANGAAGELDSTQVGSDGSFRFTLPSAPDPVRSDIFIASIQHAGVLYFGPAVTRVVELDTLYTIHAYDTLLAPTGGVDLAIEARNIFLDPDSGGSWRVTDLFVVRNDEPRTVVAREGGRTWSYPLPAGASDVLTGEGDMTLDVAAIDAGRLVIDAALQPGQRVFVARYRLESPFIDFPTPGRTEALDVLVRDPGPPLEVDGLDPVDRVELEDGGPIYRRYSAVDYAPETLRLVEGRVTGPPPVEWIAVALAVILTVGGLLAVRAGRQRPVPAGAPGAPGASNAPASASARQRLLREIARMDEDFEAESTDDPAAIARYRARRQELLDRIRGEA